MIGKLLHLANSYPNAVDSVRFYKMKERILDRWGMPDGYDIQHIEGAECWTCGGTGLYVGFHPSGDEWEDTCLRCGGGGWFKRPVWIALQRYRLGRFVFHIPREWSYECPEPDTTRIEGYVSHPDYGYRWPEFAAIVLGLVFDRRLAALGILDRLRRLWVVRLVTRRCIHCRKRLWSTKFWECVCSQSQCLNRKRTKK